MTLTRNDLSRQNTYVRTVLEVHLRDPLFPQREFACLLLNLPVNTVHFRGSSLSSMYKTFRSRVTSPAADQMTEIVQKTQLTPEMKHELFRHTKKMGLKSWT